MKYKNLNEMWMKKGYNSRAHESRAEEKERKLGVLNRLLIVEAEQLLEGGIRREGAIDIKPWV